MGTEALGPMGNWKSQILTTSHHMPCGTDTRFRTLFFVKVHALYVCGPGKLNDVNIAMGSRGTGPRLGSAFHPFCFSMGLRRDRAHFLAWGKTETHRWEDSLGLCKEEDWQWLPQPLGRCLSALLSPAWRSLMILGIPCLKSGKKKRVGTRTWGPFIILVTQALLLCFL